MATGIGHGASNGQGGHRLDVASGQKGNKAEELRAWVSPALQLSDSNSISISCSLLFGIFAFWSFFKCFGGPYTGQVAGGGGQAGKAAGTGVERHGETTGSAWQIVCEVLLDNLWCRMAKLIAEQSGAKLSIDESIDDTIVASRERFGGSNCSAFLQLVDWSWR